MSDLKTNDENLTPFLGGKNCKFNVIRQKKHNEIQMVRFFFILSQMQAAWFGTSA